MADRDKYTRRFETNDDAVWMKFNTNDLLYGAIQYFATVDNDRTYITKQCVSENIQQIVDICGMSRRTARDNIHMFTERGLLKLIDIPKEDGFIYPAYEFVCGNEYIEISKDTLIKLLQTNNRFILKTYIYLLKNYKNRNTIFMLKDISKAIGYSEDSKNANEDIKEALSHLEENKYISFSEEYIPTVDKNGRIFSIKKYRLHNVLTN